MPGTSSGLAFFWLSWSLAEWGLSLDSPGRKNASDLAIGTEMGAWHLGGDLRFVCSYSGNQPQTFGGPTPSYWSASLQLIFKKVRISDQVPFLEAQALLHWGS